MATLIRGNEMAQYTFGTSDSWSNTLIIREKVNKGFKYYTLDSNIPEFLKTFQKSTCKSKLIEAHTIGLWIKPKNVTWLDIKEAQILLNL